MVKSPPASAGDMGSIPGLGRSHMLQGNRAREPQVLSPQLEPAPRNRRGPRGVRSRPCEPRPEKARTKFAGDSFQNIMIN